MNFSNVSTFQCRNPLYCNELCYRPGVWGSGGRRFESCRPDGVNALWEMQLSGLTYPRCFEGGYVFEYVLSPRVSPAVQWIE